MQKLTQIFITVLCFCLALHTTQAQEFEWAVGGGGEGSDNPTAIVTDDSGYVYIAGNYREDATFDTFLLQKNGSVNGFIIKYSPLGQVISAISVYDI